MTDLSIITTPAQIEINFVALKERLQSELVAYDLEVTIDNLAEAKTKATELNKLSQELDAKRKEKVAEVSAPIKIFEAQIKELVTMAQDGRTKILNQVKVYEDKIRAVARRELLELRDKLFDDMQIKPEYRKADIESLAIISNLTDNMKLTKKAIDQVTSLVQTCRIQQDRHDLRANQIVARSIEAGLKVPLRWQEIGFFLIDSDQEFDQKLAERIEIEKQKQAQMEERILQSKQAEEARKAQAVPKVEPKPAPAGKKLWTVQATFEITTPADYAGDIGAMLEKKLRDAGFTTLAKVEVV